MSDKNYRQLGGVVDNILDTVKMVQERGFWEEIVTLVIPGFNDSEDEIKRASSDGATVIFSTHVMQHAERLCQRLRPISLLQFRLIFPGM